MKTSCLAVAAFCMAVEIYGQSGATGPDAVNMAGISAQAPLYFAGERSAHQQTWFTVVPITNGLGQVSFSTNRAYVEISTGLAFQDTNGQWELSQEQISPLPTGGAAALQTGHKTYFPSNHRCNRGHPILDSTNRPGN